MRALSTLLAAVAVLGQAYAADLTVQVRSPDGKAVADAVVTFTPAGGVSRPIHFDWPYQILQRDLQFNPYILIVPAGAEVRFPNLDRVRHHVYSLSPGNRFELELFGRDESRGHRFMRPGVAAIGCNIHDQMQAYIIVVDTPFVGRTGPDGKTRIPNASGAGELRVWHHQSRARGGVVARNVTLASSGAALESFELPLRNLSTPHH